MNRFIFLCATMLCLVFAAPGVSAQSYSKATKVGPAKGLDAIGCRGGFIDINGNCWKCPSGYKHDDIFKSPTDPKVCKDEGGRDKRKGNRHGKATGLAPDGALTNTICPGNQWVSRVDGNNWCYSCDSGYKHDASKFGNQDGVCYKDREDRYSKADRMTGSVFCEQRGAFSDPIDGGTCWTCPASHPTRTALVDGKFEPVNGPKACVSAACGQEGGRPCLVTERFPSCDKGLAEDFLEGKCVPDVSEKTCMAIVQSLKRGEIPAQMRPTFEPIVNDIKARRAAQGQMQAYQSELVRKEVEKLVPQLREFRKQMQNQKAALEKTFDPEIICSKTKLQAAIRNMVKPPFSGRFFTAQSTGLSASAVVGVQVSLSYVTDWNQAAGVYITFGGQFAPVTVGAGGGTGIMFFPGTTLSGFEGLGWGIGASVGIPNVDVGVGVDLAYPFPFTGQVIPVGYGVNLGAGVNAIPTPADASISLTNSWKIWSTGR